MLAWLGFGVGRAPATRPADSGSGSRQRRSSAGGTAPEASNAAPNAVPARSSEANQLLFEQLAKRIENARAELGAIRRRVVPAALLFALVLLGLGGGLGGYLSSTRSPGSPLVLCLCAPGVLALALAIMPDDARIARVTALACGLALFVIAAAVLWEVSERAKRIADLGACEPVTPLYNQARNWITDLQYKGSLVHFLEPLTTTHNPIEDGFKCGRSWARANCDRLHTFQSPEHFIRESLMSVGYQQARHCVHNCSSFGGIPAYDSMLARFDAGERSDVTLPESGLQVWPASNGWSI
ncbi:hypothetical protein T492DRAFT_891114 [Pavlovales sp. CCMP2436]|nr:hypothetical protein T492DRAFT_891114 [Pavlovales sp. CCMP2436]